MLRRALVGLAFVTLAGTAGADVEVTGKFKYEDKAWTYTGWTGGDPTRNIRRATVEIYDDGGSVIASGTTNGSGTYSIMTPAPSEGSEEIFIRVLADTVGDSSYQRIRVTDNTGALYVSVHPQSFFIDDGMTTLDVGTVTVPKITSLGDESNPFNLFDLGIHSWNYITGECGRSKVFWEVRLRWPESGSFASFNQAFISADDGYDDAVILHELGHVMHNLYSDNDEPGGTHFFGDSDQDPRLSLGEGFATFFAGAVMIEKMNRDALYVDASGSAQTGAFQLRLRLEEAQPYGNDSYGAADEVAVACTLYDVVDTENAQDLNPSSDDDQYVAGTMVNGKTVHDAWFEVFEGPVATAVDLTLNDFWDGWFSTHGGGGQYVKLVNLYAKRRVQYFNDQNEPNNTFATAAPIVGTNQWSGSRTLYYGSGGVPVPGVNDLDWYEADLVIGSQMEVKTRYPSGASDADTQCDTQLSAWTPGEVSVGNNNNGGTGRNARLTFDVTETGKWKFRVRTLSTMRDYGRYEYRLNYLFRNFLPNVTSPLAASPAVLGPLEKSSVLSIGVQDAQALTYDWRVVDGGKLSGTGPSVVFTPPQRRNPGTYAVEVTITDALGAVIGPFSVSVSTTRPAGGLTPP
jgi:hypothetical protein